MPSRTTTGPGQSIATDFTGAAEASDIVWTLGPSCHDRYLLEWGAVTTRVARVLIVGCTVYVARAMTRKSDLILFVMVVTLVMRGGSNNQEDHGAT